MRNTKISALFKDANFIFFSGITFLSILYFCESLLKNENNVNEALESLFNLFVLFTFYYYIFLIPVLMFEDYFLLRFYITKLKNGAFFNLGIIIVSLLFFCLEYYLFVLVANFTLPQDHHYVILTNIDQLKIGHLYIIFAKVGAVTLLYSLRHYKDWFNYTS